MSTSNHHHMSSASRPRSGQTERPLTRDAIDHSIPIPSRTSSLHSRITQPIPASLSMKMAPRNPKTLTHAYLVCGVGREPSQWVRAPAPTQGKITHMKGAVNQFWLPEILGSSPKVEQENDIAKALHSAMRACFPHDVEICTGRVQPQCVHHTFVLQQDSSKTLYGIALRVWSRADDKRADAIREIRKRLEGPEFYESSEEIYWIPYALSFLSRYPLYDLLGDYLRGMWIHWNKATNLFHAEEVSRILSFPAPRLNDLVRIDMKDYALCYHFPSSPTGFQNFSLWPLFTCLSIPNIVGVMEAALSSTRRIIFISQHPSMLTLAAETVRFSVRVFEWSGLYVPVVHAHHASDLVQEPGPYILGVTAECRSLFTAPGDALVVDLDRNFVMTNSPPTVLSSSQRNKMISRLTRALKGEVVPSGVPMHLRSAYAGGKLIPAGKIIVMKGEVECVQDPLWWNQDGVMAVFDHVCEKLGRNTGVKAVFGGSVKKPLMTKISVRHLNEIVRERNQYSRDALEAWQDFINLKMRMDLELTKVTKRNNFLVEELDSWKSQFEKFQAFASQLTKETNDLKARIETHKRENRRLSVLVDQQKDDANRLTLRLTGTEKERDEALEALVMQQEVADELERERNKNTKELKALQTTNETLLRQRDEAQRVVLHLRSLINGQALHMENIISTISDEDSADSVKGAFDDFDEDMVTPRRSGVPSRSSGRPRHRERHSSQSRSRSHSRASTPGGRSFDGDYVNPEMERKFFNSPRESRRFSQLSLVDTADRNLKDKTEAIADIIRKISAQCAAVIDGLEFSEDVIDEARDEISSIPEETTVETRADRGLRILPPSQDMHDSFLNPNSTNSSSPPTPELTHRSSTALSMASTSFSDTRYSLNHANEVDVPTKILEVDDNDNILDGLQEDPEVLRLDDKLYANGASTSNVTENSKSLLDPNPEKAGESLLNRASARVSAFGSA